MGKPRQRQILDCARREPVKLRASDQCAFRSGDLQGRAIREQRVSGVLGRHGPRRNQQSASRFDDTILAN